MNTLILTTVFGWTGYYRFKKGQILLGILYLFTFGLFSLGWIVDIFCALIDLFKKQNAEGFLRDFVGNRKSVPLSQEHSNADELRQYKMLLDENAITAEEYERKKEAILGGFTVCEYCGTKNDKSLSECSACGAKLP